MTTEKIDMTDLYDKFLTTYKQTHVSVNGQQAQIECCKKIWSTKAYVAVENEFWKKPGKGSIVNFFIKVPTKKSELFINML